MEVDNTCDKTNAFGNAIGNAIAEKQAHIQEEITGDSNPTEPNSQEFTAELNGKMSTTEITHINDEETEENVATKPNFSETMSKIEMTHINDEETENTETEPNFSEPMSTIDMTHFNDETMGPHIERELNRTGFDAERNETMCRMAISLCSDEQFNSHNEIPIGNATIIQVDLAKQNDPCHSGLTRILSDSQHESNANNKNQAVQQNIENKSKHRNATRYCRKRYHTFR